MRLFSKEEIASFQKYVNSLNKEYKENAFNKNLEISISSEKVNALNNLNTIISSKYR